MYAKLHGPHVFALCVCCANSFWRAPRTVVRRRFRSRFTCRPGEPSNPDLPLTALLPGLYFAMMCRSIRAGIRGALAACLTAASEAGNPSNVAYRQERQASLKKEKLL
jgi:hypothetical protein